MDSVRTERLLLIPFQTNEIESQQLEWFHQVWKNEEATHWSSRGPCRSKHESQAWMAGILPSSDVNTTRIAYAVLRPMDDAQSGGYEDDGRFWQMAGIVTLLPMKAPMPVVGDIASRCVRTFELGYLFLPSAWGHGYATESVRELLNQCLAHPRLSGFGPGDDVDIWVRVHQDNTRSLRVVEKLGFRKLGRLDEPDPRFPEGLETASVVLSRMVLPLVG